MRRAAIGQAGAQLGIRLVPDRCAGLGIKDQIWRTRAVQVHGDGRVAALGPQVHPVGKSRAATTVDEHHAGKLRARLRLSQRDGRAIKGEDLGVLALVFFSGVGQRMDGLILPHPLHGGHIVFEFGEIPRPHLFGAMAGG